MCLRLSVIHMVMSAKQDSPALLQGIDSVFFSCISLDFLFSPDSYPEGSSEIHTIFILTG